MITSRTGTIPRTGFQVSPLYRELYRQRRPPRWWRPLPTRSPLSPCSRRPLCLETSRQQLSLSWVSSTPSMAAHWAPVLCPCVSTVGPRPGFPRYSSRGCWVFLVFLVSSLCLTWLYWCSRHAPFHIGFVSEMTCGCFCWWRRHSRTLPLLGILWAGFKPDTCFSRSLRRYRSWQIV